MEVKMKKLTAGFALLLICAVAHATALNSPDLAIGLKSTLSPALLKVVGVIGVGVGACNPSTGEEADPSQDFVYCVRVDVDINDQDAVENLETLYPIGTQENGIYIDVEPTDPAHLAPRMSSGN